MFKSSYRIARVWGIPINIHVSLLILMALFALRAYFTDGPGGVLLVLLIEVGVFTSIALHELGHSFVALRKGCRVHEITLMFIGGAAQMEEIPRRPRDELLMAIAGPLVSLTLGVVCFGGGLLLMQLGLGYAGLVISTTGWINFILAGFNLIPAFPMDGGRVLRALLTSRMGRVKATYVASRIGKIVAIIFGIIGFARNWVLVAIAFFIYTAAENEYRMVQMTEAARDTGFGGWPPWPPTSPPPRGGAFDEDADDDEIIVSPPPYERKRDRDSRWR